MEEIRLDLSPQQFDDLIIALDEIKDVYANIEMHSKVAVYENLLTSILVQKAFQDYALIQTKNVISQNK